MAVRRPVGSGVTVMALTATQLKHAQSGRLTDGQGLYILVKERGKGWWRFDYRFQGKRKTLSMGVYPDVSLSEARQRRDDARQQVARGIDPSHSRHAEKAARAGRNSFEAVAREWFTKRQQGWSKGHADRIIRRLERDVFPWIGAEPITAIKPATVLTALRRVEARGAIETAHRAMQTCSQIFRYAVASGRVESDPTRDLKNALERVKENHFSAIVKPSEVGALLRAIDGYEGSYVTRAALQLAPLTFVRPGELRQAEWSEVDLQASEWRIPAEKMKARRPHIVPLSREAVNVLNELNALTGRGRYLFPSVRTSGRPMSENTVNAALRRLGYTKEEMTGHGFRSMASTLLNEQGFNRDAIERQLAHVEGNAVRAAYNYAEYLPERRQMMQDWADYLEGLRG